MSLHVEKQERWRGRAPVFGLKIAAKIKVYYQDIIIIVSLGLRYVLLVPEENCDVALF